MYGYEYIVHSMLDALHTKKELSALIVSGFGTSTDVRCLHSEIDLPQQKKLHEDSAASTARPVPEPETLVFLSLSPRVTAVRHVLSNVNMSSATSI